MATIVIKSRNSTNYLLLLNYVKSTILMFLIEISIRVKISILPIYRQPLALFDITVKIEDSPMGRIFFKMLIGDNQYEEVVLIKRYPSRTKKSFFF